MSMRMFLTDRNVRRLAGLGVFLGLLYVFRHLAVLLVFFTLFERGLGFGARFAKKRFGVPVMASVVLQIIASLAALAGLVYVGWTRVVPAVPIVRTEIAGQFAHLRVWLHARGLDHNEALQTESLLAKGEHYAGNVVTFLGSVGQSAIYMVMGLVLAVVYLAEQEKLEAWYDQLPHDGAPRLIVRYLSYVCDAISITAQLQVIVALVNTVVTLPVLLIMGLPSVPALMAFLFSMGLIPVVGGVVSGAVMGVLAYVHKGTVGVVVFFVSTFFLHKIESYYLSPRLTARHVSLPGFVIITSLVLFEHLFGLVGLFLSFPALYVAARIRDGWHREERERFIDEAIAEGIIAVKRSKPPPPEETTS
jgi:predicted PurR-regulated permease PerM